MTFPVFPVLYAYSINKKPTFKTLVETPRSGREVTRLQRVLPLWEFELRAESLRDETQNQTPDRYFSGYTDLQQIMGLFLACGGQFGWFYFNDSSDNSRNEQGIGTGDGSATAFRFVRTITYGSLTFTEPVGGVNLGENITVFVNGIEIPQLGNWSVSADSLYLVFNSAPANGAVIQVSFSYYYICHFITDDLDFEEFMQNRWSIKSIKFQSVNVLAFPPVPVPSARIFVLESPHTKTGYCYPTIFGSLAAFIFLDGSQDFDYEGSVTVSLVDSSATLTGDLVEDGSGGIVFFDEIDINETGEFTFQLSAPEVTDFHFNINWDAWGPNTDNAICLHSVNRILTAATPSPPSNGTTGIFVVWYTAQGFQIEVGNTLDGSYFPAFTTETALFNESEIRLAGVTSSPTEPYVVLAGVVTDPFGWHQLIVSWSTALQILQVVADGVLLSDMQINVTGTWNSTLNFSDVSDIIIAGAGSTYGVLMSDVIFGKTAGFVDLSDSANISHWRTVGGKPTGNLSLPGGIFTSLSGNVSNYLTGNGWLAPFAVINYATSLTGEIHQATLGTITIP